jgi:hypothetical protein
MIPEKTVKTILIKRENKVPAEPVKVITKKVETIISQKSKTMIPVPNSEPKLKIINPEENLKVEDGSTGRSLEERNENQEKKLLAPKLKKSFATSERSGHDVIIIFF